MSVLLNPAAFMDHPFFFEPILPAGTGPFQPGEEATRHMVTVLRMRKGERVYLTDGRGRLMLAEILEADRKKVTLVSRVPGIAEWNAPADLAAPHPAVGTGTVPSGAVAEAPIPLILGLSLLKNAARFEWVLEKATEIGVTAIVPLVCARTERGSFRQDRLRQIVISAMLQSQQVWLPELREPVPYGRFILESFSGLSYIAHCLPEEKSSLGVHPAGKAARLLIGPEGDFSPPEISLAQEAGWLPVSLGSTRLRSETAAIVGVTLLRGAMEFSSPHHRTA